MGGGNSKSSFDRRNSVERRTQRRVLINAKIRLEKTEKELNKFVGTLNDERYNEIRASLMALRKDLHKRSMSMQQKNKQICIDLQKRVIADLKTLEEKAKETQEKQAKRRENKNHEEEINKAVKHRTSAIIERQDSDEITDTSRPVSEIRQTAEIKVVQVTPKERPVSESEKRVSVLRFKDPNEVTAKEIEEIKREVEEIEFQISEFIGRRNGRHYNRLKSKLIGNMQRLNEFSVSDEYLVEQINLCLRYVGSCLNFLDEKAVDEESSEKDYGETEEANRDMETLSRLMATTSV